MPEEQLQVPLSWVGLDEMPILLANHFLMQFEADGSFVLSAGQATAPPLLGTPEEIKAQAEKIEFVPVRPLARLNMTEGKLREFIAVLEANLKNFEQSQNQIDPRQA